MFFTSSRSRSIRRQMLLGVNAVLLVALSLFLAFDFSHDSHQRISDKRQALHEEAKLIAPMVYRLSQFDENYDKTGDTLASTDAIATLGDDISVRAALSSGEQRKLNILGSSIYIRNGSTEAVITTFLRAVRDRRVEFTDHNYQIAARIGDRWFRVKRSSEKAFVSSMGLRSTDDEGWGIVDMHEEEMLVACSTIENGAVYVAESLTQLRSEARSLLMWRTSGLAMIGLGMTALIDLILLRLVSRPLVELIGTLRRIKRGDYSTKAPGGSCREVASLVSGVNKLGRSLDRAAQDRERQLSKAHRMQQNLFPKVEVEGPVKISCVHRAANKVGGDYYDHKLMCDGSVVIVLADVSGHGVAAAMGAAMLKTLFDSLTDRCLSLREIVDGINRGFHKVSLEEDFATMVLLRIDSVSRRMQYVNAGHESIYILDGVGAGAETDGTSDWGAAVSQLAAGPFQNENTSESDSGGGTAVAIASPVRRIALPTRDVPRGVRELESNGPLVGVMEDIDWEVGEVPLAPGDRVVVYTDGISEARSMTQGMLGRKRFLEMMSWNQQLELSTYTRRLVREVDEFREGLPASDDVTLMATEY